MSSVELKSYQQNNDIIDEYVPNRNFSSRQSSLYDSVIITKNPSETEGNNSMSSADNDSVKLQRRTSYINSDISLTSLERKEYVVDVNSNGKTLGASLPSNGGMSFGLGAELDKRDSTIKGNIAQVQHAFKSYGSGKNKVNVLQGLNMCVPQGSIYGLLGPSGCGKTTLLGCIVNRIKLDSGDIFLYGFPPGSAGAAVPGHRVGYMPQELALYQEFSIGETLSYFGRIHHLTQEKIKEKTNFLVTFLDLPPPNRLINQLSGGQQRRVSLAAALVHEPDLLILDEPTVGVDPLLRSSIWKHLLDVCSTGRTTIIITTHYIEEARQADKVGLMRAGRLLAETSPSSLINHFKIPSLEDIFLKLCLQDSTEDDLEHGRTNQAFDNELDDSKLQGNTPSTLPSARGVIAPIRKEVSTVTGHTILRDSEDLEVTMSPWVATSKYERIFSTRRLSALLIKNFIRLWRNPGFLVFSFLIPPLQTALFCLAVGGTPYNLNVAVVNEDVGFNPDLLPSISLNLSDIFLDQLNHHTLNLHNFDEFETGYTAVEDGKAWSLIHFKEDFTCSFIAFYASDNVSDEVIDNSKIDFYMDNTNSQIAITIWLEIIKSMEEFLVDITSTVEEITGVNMTKLSLPIKVQPPIYGSDSSTFTEFMAPGVILSITYFMAVGLTALSFVIERKEGLFDRSWVSGVQGSEVMLAHIATQMTVLLVQIALILVFMFLVFEIPCQGNMIWVILLSILQGLCGMTFGLMTSALAEDENTALMMALGIFYPMILLSGIVWPVEGMPTALRYIAYMLPQTYACDAIRAVLYRGWDITYPIVYLGYIVTIIWLFIHLIITFIAIKIKE